MATCPLVCLDGVFLPASEARISVFDRGLLFAHAAYEVTAVVGGRLVDLDAHIARLVRTLGGLDLALGQDGAGLRALHEELVARNRLEEGVVYLQVTAGGEMGRDFAGPETLTPRLILFADARPLVDERARDGIAAITLADTRWARRDLKTTQLLSQALAYRRARAAGAQTAIMHEDGLVTEAASANVWIVTADGELVTRELSSAILAGVTRATMVSLTPHPVHERAFSLEELRGALEVIQTSSGAMILPVVEIDGVPVGDGRPGPVTRDLQRAYFLHIGLDLPVRAPWIGG